MPTDDQARLLRTVPSTNPDGLDLTVAEARALSSELFERTFGMPGLDDVPTVGPGFLKQAPQGCGWCVRFSIKVDLSELSSDRCAGRTSIGP
jgi:hypothetical protein